MEIGGNLGRGALYFENSNFQRISIMGRWSGGGRRTVEQTRSIDIGTLRRAGYVEDDWIQLPHQTLEVVQVPSHFGGQRSYFACDCGRMVEKLYAPGGRPWRCRHCYRLTYATRQAAPRIRHLMKAQKVRRLLGGSLSMIDDFPPRPKGMHWKRYERLRRRHDAAEAQFLGMSSALICQLTSRLNPHRP
jgi:hypothetical protein